MIGAALLLGLLLPHQQPADGQAIFEAVLRCLRAEKPGMQMYLANRPMRDLRTAPPAAPPDSLMHDPAWIARMERLGVVSGWCTPKRNVLGCSPPDSLAGRPHFGASFWPLEAAGADSLEVAVTLTLPPLHPEVAHVEKREYTLRRTADGRWEVVRYEVAGVS